MEVKSAVRIPPASMRHRRWKCVSVGRLPSLNQSRALLAGSISLTFGPTVFDRIITILQSIMDAVAVSGSSATLKQGRFLSALFNKLFDQCCINLETRPHGR